MLMVYDLIDADPQGLPTHVGEPHAGGGTGRLNWLRAGVLGAHLAAELGIDPDDLANPRQAAAASAVSFTLGALLPPIAILLPPESWRVPVCVLAVLAALALTRVVSARMGGSNPRRAVLRVLIGGTLGLTFPYGVGHLFGTAIG